MSTTPTNEYPLGATWLDQNLAGFCVWAPNAKRVRLKLYTDPPQTILMQRDDDGYHTATVDNLPAGTRYRYLFGRKQRRADPASKYQPEGVDGPSEIVDSSYRWRDEQWHGIPLADYIIYELHVGCFSEAGDFDGAARRLDTLADLGITAIEVMPVAQFPGARNWGYDGVFPFAVQNTYGGPTGLKRLVNACHRRGIAVVLDVVYNHLGPEGNYFADFGPYFTGRYHTPWGRALNFDGHDADHVRRFMIENAIYWIDDCHLDALRLDAIQMIFDNSARPFLAELAAAVHDRGRQLGRQVHVIGETNQNDVRQVTAPGRGGLGLDAVWTEDFHRSVHALLTGERTATYQDFGPLDLVCQALSDGFVLDGRYSQWHRRRHGSSSRRLSPEKIVVYLQNHDLAGNRLYGERLGHLISFDEQKLAAALLLLSPYVPMLFMGEEYSEDAPFLYFVDHSSEFLLNSVREGRMRDHPEFVRSDQPVPDPGRAATYRRSQLNHGLRSRGRSRALWQFYRELIRLRKSLLGTGAGQRERPAVRCDTDAQLLLWQAITPQGAAAAIFHVGREAKRCDIDLPGGEWSKLLDSADQRWFGPGTCVLDRVVSEGSVQMDLPAMSVVVLARQ